MSGRAADDFLLIADLAANEGVSRSAREAARLFSSASDALASGRFEEGTTRFDEGVDVAVKIEKAFNRSDDGSC
jgi:plasmid stabilization system protein ParE